MRWTFPFYLNIRQKVMLGLSLCMLVIGSVGGISYHYLREIERKQHVVEIADDLGNVMLEIRRKCLPSHPTTRLLVFLNRLSGKDIII